MDDASANDKLSSKLGRKGDPRMHRSVAARIGNPDLTLFEALRMGGFDYPTNDDASVMDAEKVTLGQRKNQLSRRLRMVRKQSSRDGDSTEGGEPNCATNGALGGASNGSGLGRNSSASSSGLSNEAQRELEKLMKHSRNAKISSGGGSSGHKRDASTLSCLEDDDIDAEEIPDEAPKRARIAKFHPDYAPLFVPPSASARNSFGSSATPNASFHHHTHQVHQLSASHGSGMPSRAMGAAAATLGGAGNAYSGSPALFSQGASMLSASGNGSGGRPSGVAIASLSATAHAVGLTLEQLAVSLGSSPSRLAKVLTDLNSNSADSTAKQLQVALHLFQSESRALYSKCMLLAGIHPNHCQESSPNHLQFALNAWQLEGKRLQDLLGNSHASRRSLSIDMSFNQMATAAAATGGSKASSISATRNRRASSIEQQLEGSENGSHHDHEDDNGRAHHSHSHSRSHHSSRSKDGAESDVTGGSDEEGYGHRRHVHRLEGRCGHRAILHQPKNGSAHIDFVVGSKVECYHGIEPIGETFNSFWPSKYRCEDLEGCSNQCTPANGARDRLFGHHRMNIEPKTYELSEIDLADPEWNMDVNGDGSLARLFKMDDRGDGNLTSL
jgi:hypothetical protein